MMFPGRLRWGRVILERSTSSLKPFEEAGANIVHHLKLNRPPGFLLNDRRPGADFPITHNVADPDFHQIAASQFAIEGQVKEGSIANSSVLIQKETDRPNLPGFERPFRSNSTSGVP
ncbi:hypothetical protein [Sphingobium sp. YR768]|uniref:hypothetical protein n=1 Tax=Sphingobium sp. YR768 TaxID=1884365 RepID=UPI0015A7265F